MSPYPLSTPGIQTGFPDHVARVSYIASVVSPDDNGNYLKDLKGGMKLLATRLAPSYFPGAIVQKITTQVDGYFPSGELTIQLQWVWFCVIKFNLGLQECHDLSVALYR